MSEDDRAATWSGAFVFAGETVRARMNLDAAELGRREGGATFALPSPAALEALFILPHDVRVEVETVPQWARDELDHLAPGLVERAASSLRRVYQPPAVVHEVVADGALEVEDQAAALRWIAAVAPCTLVLEPERDQSTLDFDLRDRFGIAVWTGVDRWQGLAPAPLRRVRLTSQRWLLAERAWASFSSSAAARSPRP